MGRCFNPSRSILAGMDTATLQAQLNVAQQAYLALTTGGKGEFFSYAQGDGSKTVKYTVANLPDLVQTIKLLQAQLGIDPRPRRAFSVQF